MERGLVTLIGMSIAYAASLLGLGLAWYAYRRRTSARLSERAASRRLRSGGGARARRTRTSDKGE